MPRLPYPFKVCRYCGLEAKHSRVAVLQVQWQQGKCDVCFDCAPVTCPSVFNWPNFPGHTDSSLR